MDEGKRLEMMQQMLGRLTGQSVPLAGPAPGSTAPSAPADSPQEDASQQAAPEPAAPAQAATQEPEAERLNVLKGLLSRLED
jgi:hypothetical protein